MIKGSASITYVKSTCVSFAVRQVLYQLSQAISCTPHPHIPIFFFYLEGDGTLSISRWLRTHYVFNNGLVHLILLNGGVTGVHKPPHLVLYSAGDRIQGFMHDGKHSISSVTCQALIFPLLTRNHTGISTVRHWA